MAYTDIDDPSVYFRTKIYSGTGSNAAITFDETDNSMQPDFLWGKCRGSAESNKRHVLTDSVRGINRQLASNTDTLETTYTNSFTAFGSNGFSVGDDNGVNENSNTFVAWCWKAGTSFTNDASSTSIGSIDSTGSASDTAGFSIVSFTGTGSNGTIKHGLSTAPSMVIIKRRDADNDWRVGSSALTSFVKHVNLNTTAAESDLAAAFNSTGPTTSVFSVGTSVSTNADGGTYIAYCFANKQGYLKVGSYKGNGSANGAFIYTGFKPAWLLAKKSSATADWFLIDNKRSTINPTNHQIEANSSAAEDASGRFDFLSNGFKCVSNSTGSNGSGTTYIFMAFAENPFVNSNGVPNNAR